MARLRIKGGLVEARDLVLKPGRNTFGRDATNDFPIDHDSISHAHCEVWLTADSVAVHDLGSTNGTFIDRSPVPEGAYLFSGQTLKLGSVELLLEEAPVRVAIPPLGTAPPPPPTTLPDGTPCCANHSAARARYQCGQCARTFCGECVRELKITGGKPLRFCPDCGGQCAPLYAPAAVKKKSLFDKLRDLLTR